MRANCDEGYTSLRWSGMFSLELKMLGSYLCAGEVLYHRDYGQFGGCCEGIFYNF